MHGEYNTSLAFVFSCNKFRWCFHKAKPVSDIQIEKELIITQQLRQIFLEISY